jgi:RIO-like serine/threonine protein kinase
MHCKNIIVADNFPQEFESSNIQIPDGRRADFEKLGSSKFALVLKFNFLLKSKVYSIVLKKYFMRNFKDCFKFLFRQTRAQRAYNAGQMLIENGFLTPPAVAHGRKFLMTLEVRDSTPIFKLLGTLAADKKKKLIQQFAQTIGTMHDKGIVHGDLRLGNVLAKSNSENFEFYFLDNERTKKYEQIPWKLRVKNLVQINMHRDNVDENDRKLFFDAYLSQQSTPMDSHKLSEEVISRTNRRLAKKK